VRLGIDIGGTFTDVVAVRADGTVWSLKIPSTPDDFARAIESALTAWLQAEGSAVTEVVHGTTVATNAILERKGATTALVTTRGFRDILEIGRLRTPRLYDLTWEKPPPLVPRRLRFEVDERLDAAGEVVRPLDRRQAESVLERVLDEKVESIAICLLHAYANPAHEREVGELLRELVRHRYQSDDLTAPSAARPQDEPAAPPFVSLSSEVLPEVKEYERTSTTVLNAYLQPVVSRYLVSLEQRVRERCPGRPVVRVMQSSGGVMPARAAAERPIHIIESGPAAGVIAALTLARRIEEFDVLTIDMGGTTAKASLIERGAVMRSPEYEVGGELSGATRLQRGGGYPLRVPAIDLAEVGAGGGSVIRADVQGRLRVGPGSAGAVPGPACYALGGEEATLTDANLVLGYLPADRLAGGAVPLDARRAWQAVTERVARPLGLEPLEAAHGAHRVAIAGMARAARAVSVERGRDPRQSILVAFGGNGPLHAVELARLLGMRRVVVPPSAGLFSAFGLLWAESERHEVQSFPRRLADLDAAEMLHRLEAIEESLMQAFRAEGHPREDVRLVRTLDLRYVGQSFELGVRLEREPRSTTALPQFLASAFIAEHERRYGHRAPDDPIEVVNLRVTAAVSRPDEEETFQVHQEEAQLPAGAQRECYFGRDLGLLPAPLRTRASLRTPASGPLLIDEYDATILVPPGASAHRDGFGNIIIDVEGSCDG
jgi:N-methylhydantoinase A